MAEDTRPLAGDERALFDWFLGEWAELAQMRSSLALDAPAVVSTVPEDGYTTLSVPYIRDAGRSVSSPYPGEGRGEVEGHPFEVLFFIGEDTAMVEVIWSAGTWPRRLPRPDELHPHERT